MKNFIAILLCFGTIGIFGQSAGVTSYIDKYGDNEDFTSITVNKKMFQMLATVASGDNEMDPDVKDMINNLDELKILTSKSGISDHFNAVNKLIEKDGFEELMRVKDKGDNARFMVKDSDGGNIVDELVLVVSGDEFVLLDFIGKIDLTKISKLSKSINMGGLEHLEKIKED